MITFTHDIAVVASDRNLLMANYRLILSLLVQDYSYREIEAMAHCSHRA